MKKIYIFMILTALPLSVQANTMYRSPSSGDKGAYYIVEKKLLKNNVFHVISSRVGKGQQYTDFTKLKVDCNSMQYMVLGGGEAKGFQKKPIGKLSDWPKGSKWTSLVTGSSKSDLVQFICKK